MVRQKKKYESGTATSYIARNQAIKKLQLSLQDFRRLCILKGIHPHEPKSKKKAGKGNTAPKTYYLLKDIQFLLHEPIVGKFREFKIFVRRLKKAIAKDDKNKAGRLRQNKPKYKLDHIVRERYPTFVDALRDLDDCLSMCFLFATFPKTRKTHMEAINLCKRLTVEFMHYVIASKSLRKVFISIKGIYYQCDIMGQTITWVTPHKVAYEHPTEVDYKIMATFTEFYTTLLGFVNFRLYNTLQLHYPPKLALEGETGEQVSDMCMDSERIQERLAALSQTLKMVTEDETEEMQPDEFPVSEDPDQVEEARIEAEKLQRLSKLFSTGKFFLSREVPRESLAFLLRSCGGTVSWDATVALGSSYKDTDETITHQITDRPKSDRQFLSRYYVQPQWVFDSINARRLLPVEDYFQDAILPPHLSPFVEETEDDYVPPEKAKLTDPDSGVADVSEEEDGDEVEEEEEENEEVEGEEDEIIEDDDEEEEEEEDEDDEEEEGDSEGDEDSDSDDRPRKRSKTDEDDEPHSKKIKQMSVAAGRVEVDNPEKRLKKQQDEDRKLQEMMIPKKKRQLYNKIMHSKKRKRQEVRVLQEKRAEYDKEQKKSKKKKKKSVE